MERGRKKGFVTQKGSTGQKWSQEEGVRLVTQESETCITNKQLSENSIISRRVVGKLKLPSKHDFVA